MVRRVLGGIYIDKGVPIEEADFMIYYNGSLCIISDGICDIFEDVEHGGDMSRYEFLEGYSLAIKQGEEAIWQIRDSGRKHTDKYIIGSGRIGSPRFVVSLKPFYEAMSMS